MTEDPIYCRPDRLQFSEKNRIRYGPEEYILTSEVFLQILNNVRIY